MLKKNFIKISSFSLFLLIVFYFNLTITERCKTTLIFTPFPLVALRMLRRGLFESIYAMEMLARRVCGFVCEQQNGKQTPDGNLL